MSATMKAAVHLGQDYQENYHTTQLRKDHTIVRDFTEIDPGSKSRFEIGYLQLIAIQFQS